MKGEGIMETRLLGYYGEQAAVTYIRHKGDYHIRCCNYRNRVGEIDIIAEHGKTLVFIEVKTRLSDRCGRPGEAVEWRKQQKIAAVASSYLAQFELWDKPCRFDVIEVWPGIDDQPVIRHVVHAFLAERR